MADSDLSGLAEARVGTPNACEMAKRLAIDPYEVLTRIADRVAPGAEGLLFHPYLAGYKSAATDLSRHPDQAGTGVSRHRRLPAGAVRH